MATYTPHHLHLCTYTISTVPGYVCLLLATSPTSAVYFFPLPVLVPPPPPSQTPNPTSRRPPARTPPTPNPRQQQPQQQVRIQLQGFTALPQGSKITSFSRISARPMALSEVQGAVDRVNALLPEQSQSQGALPGQRDGCGNGSGNGSGYGSGSGSGGGADWEREWDAWTWTVAMMRAMPRGVLDFGALTAWAIGNGLEMAMW